MTELEMVDELFEIYDKNQDGVISRGEFVELVDSLLHEKGVNVSAKIFDRFDANHDGKISKDELLELVKEELL